MSFHIIIYITLILTLFSTLNVTADVTLQNNQVSIVFSSTTGKPIKFVANEWSSPTSVSILEDLDVFVINSEPLKCVDVSSFTSTDHSVTVIFDCSSKYNVSVSYYLRNNWNFYHKVSTLVTGNSKPSTDVISLINSTFSIGWAIADGSVMKNPFMDSDHVAFLRENTLDGSSGLFYAWKNPFAYYTINVAESTTTVLSHYELSMPTVDSLGTPYETEGIVVGGYALVADWAVGSSNNMNQKDGHNMAIYSIGGIRDGTLNYAERRTFTRCVEAFLEGPARTEPVKTVVGWDSNDYQMDVSTEFGFNEYRRLIDRLSQLGISHIIYGPCNNAVSTIKNSTDDWHWEEVLWLALGEDIRQGYWTPGVDALPPTVQAMLDYAESKHVKLMAYVYPPLGYRADGDSAWIYYRGQTAWATTASPEFQVYLSNMLITFAKQTNLGGFAFDYNSFTDPNHSTYSQWRGWHHILALVRAALPDIVMDHRQNSHQYGPWSWLQGSYAEPIQGDENPETYGIIAPSLHTDHVAADDLRRTTYNYRQYNFAPPARTPGFIGHQTERSTPNGTLAFWDNYIRDFDLIGFPYSLLSNIASAGLNLVHCMLPARDQSELNLLPKSTLAFWSYWLQWADEHVEHLYNAIPILSQVELFSVDGWSLMSNDGHNGYIFFFNPNYPQMNTTFTISPSIGASTPNTSTYYWFLNQIYPVTKTLFQIQYYQQVTLTLDGDSASVYELVYSKLPPVAPLVIGVNANAIVSGSTLEIWNVFDEAGTSHNVDVWVGSDQVMSIAKVTVNGDSVAFSVNNDRIHLESPIVIPSLYIPRAAQLGALPSHSFNGGIFNATFSVSDEYLSQLALRKQIYPVDWTADELPVGWLAPARSLIFISIASPNDSWQVGVSIDGTPLTVYKCYNTRHPNSGRFMGFFVDVSGMLNSNQQHTLSVSLPSMNQGQFIGLFLDNVETIIRGL
jgi:hypothetical protein